MSFLLPCVLYACEPNAFADWTSSVTHLICLRFLCRLFLAARYQRRKRRHRTSWPKHHFGDYFNWSLIVARVKFEPESSSSHESSSSQVRVKLNFPFFFSSFVFNCCVKIMLQRYEDSKILLFFLFVYFSLPITTGGSKTQVTGQVRSQVRSHVRSGQVRSGQNNRKNIFLPRKLTIFNSNLTRYEKESVIMRGIVYFKLQHVALRD